MVFSVHATSAFSVFAQIADCSEVKDLDNAAKSGLYNVNPDGRGSFLVYCDMETDGGGWTVFQRRKGGKKGNNFARTWAKYKRGFGKLNGNFWLGNEYLHRLTANQTVRLRIEVSHAPIRSF